MYTFDELQSGTLTGVLQDEAGNPIGSSDVLTLLLTIIDQNTRTVINDRYKQNVFNTNNVTLDILGNFAWNIQPEDNTIIGTAFPSGTIERHEILFEWTWGVSKYSNELYYFDVTQISELSNVGGNVYGTISGADNYFLTRLNSLAWVDASNTEKVSALTEATRLIDNLNFKGDKTDDIQYLEFPRGGDTVVPLNIMYATYELGFQLLDGVDPDKEVEILRSNSQNYGGISEGYQNSVFPEWTLAGIPSARAWRLLKPFLRDPKILVISRES